MFVKIIVSLFLLALLATYFSFLKWININVLNIEIFTLIQFFLALFSFALYLYLSAKVSKNKNSNIEENETKETIIFVSFFIFSTIILPFSLNFINKNFFLKTLETKEYIVIRKQILPIRFNSVNYMFLKDKNNKVFRFSTSNNSLYKAGDKIKLDTKKGFLGFDFLQEN